MDLRQIYIANIVGGIVVTDLATGPIDTLDFDLRIKLSSMFFMYRLRMVFAYDFVVFDGTTHGIIGMPSVLARSKNDRVKRLQ